MPGLIYYTYKIKTIRTFASLLICTILYSCAQIVTPGGGKRDIVPPKVLKYLPDSASLNFTSKFILIDFDEYVVLKDLNSQLIISPPLDKTPDITLKSKTLTIAFDKKEQLKPNTTYSINFGNAIQDFNENNPIENFKYIFSTGTYIDSLSMKGKVENGFDHTTEKGLLVMLYSNQDDSVVYKSLPDYFTKTKEDGTFKIDNIKAGIYKIVTLKDANSNYKYDGESESIGFMNLPLNVSENKPILMDLFQEPSKKVFLKKHIHDQYGKITLIFNLGSDSIQVQPVNQEIGRDQSVLSFSKNKDTLVYWIKKPEKDTLKLQVRNGSKILDTVEFKMIKKEDALKSARRPLKLSLLNNFNGSQTFDLNASLKLFFSQPIGEINTQAKILLKEDTLYYKNYGRLSYIHNPDSALSQVVTIGLWDSTFKSQGTNNNGKKASAPLLSPAVPLKENTSYHLLILPGTFTDIFGLTNDSIKINFKTREEKYYGTGKLKVTVPEIKGDFIVQLLDEKENVVRENLITKSETILYTYLYPQKYKLKIIYDENANGKWDSGDYLKKIQPEKVIYDAEAINVRSNWDVDLQWVITNDK